MSSGQTVRFIGEFDDTKLIAGVRRATTTIESLTQTKQLTLFGPEVLQDLDKLEQSTNALEQSFNTLEGSTSGVNTSLDEIGNAANTAGQNFDTLGTSTGTIEEQLAAIGTTSTTAGQSMSALGGSADTTATSMGALQSNFEGVSGGLTSTNTLFGETTGAMADVDSQAQTTGNRMEKIWSKGSAIAIGISATISGIANLIRGFRDYDEAQLRVQKANLAVSKGQEAVTKAQEKYNAAVAKYGVNSEEARKAMVDIGQAQDSLAIKQQNQAKANRAVSDSILNIALGTASSITGIGGSIIQSLDAIGGEKGIAGLSTKIKALPAAFSGAATKIGGALSSIAAGFTIVGAGIVLAMHLMQQNTATIDAFAKAGINLTTVQEDSNKAFAEMQAIMRVTHMSMLQVIEDPKKAVETYKQLGGQVSATGEIVTASVDQWDSARSGIQILFDTISKGIGDLLNLDKGIKKVDASVATHIPTVIHLSSSWRTVIKDHEPVTEQYVMGARELDMYNVVMQTSAETAKLVAAGFATLPGAVDKGTKAITSHTTATTALTAKFGPLLIDLPDLEQGTIDLATAMGEGAQADIDRKNTLAGVTTAAKLAATQFTEFTDQSKLAGETNAILRDKLEAYVTTELHVQNAQGMTLQQLKDLVDAHFDTGKATELATKATEDNKKAQEDAAKAAADLAKAQREVRDAMAESISAFSDITKASDPKEANKAWKEFKTTMQDLIPKETMNNVKAFFQDLETGSKGLGKVSKGIDILFAAITTGTDKLSSQDLKGIIAGMSSELERMATINPRAAQINKLLFEPLQKLDGAALTSKIGQIGDAINIAKTAMDKGWITADTYNDVLASLAEGTGATVNAQGQLVSKTGEIIGTMDKAGTATGKFVNGISQIEAGAGPAFTAIDAVVKRVMDLQNVFNSFKPSLNIEPKPAIDAILKVAKAADTLFNGINKAKATITVNNSQALAAINAVVNAQGKIKNILQVIKGNNSDALSKINQVVNAQGKIKNITQTITTVYKTVGSPAHTSTRVGVGAHTSTRLGTTAAVGETVAIAPLIGGGGGAGAGGTGDVNITIVNRDEFGTEKIRKFKAVLGKDRYLFGASGSGG